MAGATRFELATSAKTVEKLTPGPKPYNVVDTELKGFLLRVQPSGEMTYYARYRFNGVQTQLRLGDAAVLTPALVRDKAMVVFGQAAAHLAPQVKAAAVERLVPPDNIVPLKKAAPDSQADESGA